MRSFLGIPIRSDDGPPGALYLANKRGGHGFTEEDERGLQLFGQMAAAAIVKDLLAQELARSQQEAQRLYEFLDSMMASTANGLLALSEERRVIFANSAYQDMFGLAWPEVEGWHISQLPFGRDLGELTEQVPDPSHGKPPFRRDVVHVDHQGHRHFLTITVSRLRGGHVGLHVSFSDVTAQRVAEERVRDVSRLLSMGELIAGVAHELNTPLTTVQGFAQLLAEQDLGEVANQDVRRILEQAKRAAVVVQDLLAFARKHEPERIQLDLVDVVNRVLGLKQHSLVLNEVEVELDVPTPLPVDGDTHRLEQVILNIVNNAEQAMEGQAGPRRLLIQGRVEGRSVLLSFGDSGPGISAADQERIFSSFFTTKEEGQGTGLGLSICRTLVEEHGGEIWVESELGSGATFHVKLPRATSAGQP